MKILFKVILCLFFLFSNFAFARAGNSSGGGGNSNAMEVVLIGKQIANYIEENQSEFPEVKASDFRDVVTKTKIRIVSEKLFFEDELRDAVNFPEKFLIKINERNFDFLNNKGRISLVFHEYLAILKIDDSNYIISSRMHEKFDNAPDDLLKYRGQLFYGPGRIAYRQEGSPCYVILKKGHEWDYLSVGISWDADEDDWGWVYAAESVGNLEKRLNETIIRTYQTEQTVLVYDEETLTTVYEKNNGSVYMECRNLEKIWLN